MVFAVLLLASLPASAQEYSNFGVTLDASAAAEQIEAAIAAVEAREGLEAETRNEVVEQLRDAQVQVRARLNAESVAAKFAAVIVTAPAETELLRKTLDDEPPAVPTAESLGIDNDITLAELEQRLTRETADVAAVESSLDELEAKIEIQLSLPSQVRGRVFELRKGRQELTAIIDEPAVLGEPKVLSDARKLAALLRRDAQSAEISRLEQALLSYTVWLDLLKVQRDTMARSKVEGHQRVELLQTFVNERRQLAAMAIQQGAMAAEQAAADKHRIVRNLAEGNASLTRELPGIAADIERETGELNQIAGAASDIERRLARSQKQLEVGGLSRAIGLLLLVERRNLPQVSQYRAQVRARGTRLAEFGLAQVQVQEKRRELTSIDAMLQELMVEVSADISDTEELAEIRKEVGQLLRDRRDLLSQADNYYRGYLQVLGDLDSAQRRLLEVAGEHREFLDQNLMWIPSAPIAFTGELRRILPGAKWAFSSESWRASIVEAFESLRENIVAAVFYVLILVLVLLVRRPLARSQEAMSARVGRLSTDNIGLTLAALATAAVRALPVPLLFGATAWFLINAPQPSAFSLAVARSLSMTAAFFYNVLLFREFSNSAGVLKVHFGWQEDNLAIIRRQLDWLTYVAVPLVFIAIWLFQSESAEDRSAFGRMVFIILLVLLAFVFRSLSHPVAGVAGNYYKRNADIWVSKLRWFWYALAVGIPLLLGLLSILGYVFASVKLLDLLADTVWLLLALIVVNLVVLRWLALTRRKLALQIALTEREAQKAEREKEAQPESESEAPPVPPTPLDLDAVDQQMRKLLRAALFIVGVLAGWRIWAEMFPAFTLLDHVALWSQTVVVDGVTTIAPVTLADLFLALLVVAVTAIASKNLPGLMEIAVLRHLTLEPGSQYATITLVRYVVVTVGAVSVLNIVGWNWSQIQWLVAALSVGLGFGLQEIVANFVSGLVILFERPVRVGDTVTVGQLTGTVSRIRIRATTIIDWDRKEIIVPNKSFITEQVVNWTLSDPITRIVVPVGVSYGSDVDLVHEVIADTLEALPLVMEEPPPKVYFTGFGDSSLDFTVQVYLRQLTDRLPLTHSVHEAILKALRQNGIEIPFPQHDLHIRSTVEGGADGSRD